MTDLIFDDNELMKTACVVVTINPRGYTAEALVRGMKAAARRAFDDGSHGYITTHGYVLTLWTDDEGGRHIYSSVMTYSVQQYVNQKEG